MIKRELRILIRNKLLMESPEELSKSSQKITELLLKICEKKELQHIGVFLPKDHHEPNIFPCIHKLLLESKNVSAPVISRDGQMEFYQFLDVDVLKLNAMGILEPEKDNARLVAPSGLDAVVIPGIAFTRSGLRLGRGRGYYDRYLSKVRSNCQKIGVCFNVQILQTLPIDPWDIQMDLVMSEV